MTTRFGRAGIAVGAVAAILFVAGAFVVDGYMKAPHPVALAADSTTAPTSSLGPETVYVLPAASPAVIHVTRQATAAPAPVVHVVVPGGGDDEHESGGDD